MSASGHETSQPVPFAGLTFRGHNLEAIRRAPDMPKFIVTVNADFIVRAQEDVDFRRLIESHLSTFDGQVPFALARMLNRDRASQIEKLSGSDLIYTYLKEAAEAGKTSFLFGASPAANERAVKASKELYGGLVLGYSPPIAEEPLPATWTEEALQRISAARPAYLFVALGAPKQERWIADNLDALRVAGVECVMGCGGSIDFLGGTIKRAPRWVQSIGMEGIYRLVSEPRFFRLLRLLRSFRVFAYVFK
ncbi:WecB/TagA/CpsF family glycosyltransferase [Roseateles sp. LKC17W]|uniref:WecB/TagA/CpsF family glycosyltransferase n=1 Tax=Pelomonas margarita TaxID=3299031 RepID=A0ABW7FK46_9BURK